MSYKNVFVVSDTDIHGGISLLVAVKAFQCVGVNVNYYSHFELVRPPNLPRQPVTTPQWLAESLPRIVVPSPNLELYVLDIPVDIQKPLQFIETVKQYTIGKVTFIDHHGHNQYTYMMYREGINVVITGTSFDMTMYIPRLLNVADKELEQWAIIAATADFDSSVIEKISGNIEEAVLEYLDQAWKFELEKLPEISQNIPRYGKVGAIVNWIIRRNMGPQEFLEYARNITKPIEVPEYNVRGHVAYTITPPKPGLAWKVAWKICLLSGAKVGVVYAESPRGPAVIVAKYWKSPPEIAETVDKVVSEVSGGRSVVGHPGARSILARSREDALSLINEIVNRLNEEIESKVYTPRAAVLINERTVARAIESDFRMILRTLAEILEAQRKMYQEYLELKRRQVELLERLREREETRAD